MLVLLALGGREAAAAPLAEAECRALADEYSAMLAAGIEDTLDKGPEWASAHLARDDFERILRFLRVEEQVWFRCPRAAWMGAVAGNGVAAGSGNAGGGMPLPRRRPAPRGR